MADNKGFSWPTRIAFQWVLTIALIWLLSTNLEQYFRLTGGFPAYIIIGSLLTLMNLIIRPLLKIVFFPLHFLFGFIATIIMNWIFLWLILKIASQMDPTVVILGIEGGVGGWIVVALIFGIVNWGMKMVLKA
jgi:uncharacterized membrane protein YvlD (DUF360 family)